jgi:transglutaminase-like putative cysteine protease
MMPYLLPPELPESQLRELSDWAMSFVERQDYDLVETLKDINATIWRDFTYLPASTQLETTPFDVYVQRRGVCQDFANLFIAVARLLNIPARYRVGYVFTGNHFDNPEQGDASHAWVEVYLPGIGWRGFDPTNNALVGHDHVRVACGRNFRDATPTAGVLYRGGGAETLRVKVEVEEVEAEEP